MSSASMFSKLSFSLRLIKTSNIDESINSALKRARGFPVQFLLEFIREKLGKWFWKRRKDALSIPTQHSRGVEYLLDVRSEIADTMTIQPIDGWRFFVKAAGTFAGLHISTLVCLVYSKDFLFARYSENIYPCVGQQVEEHTCFPPDEKCGPGRQKKSRWKSWKLVIRNHNVRNDVDDLQVSHPEGRPVSRPEFFLLEDLQVSRPVFSLPEDLQISRPKDLKVSRPEFFLPEDLQVSRPVFSLPEDFQLSHPEGRPVSRSGFFLPEDLQVSRPVFSLPEDLQLSHPEGRPVGIIVLVFKLMRVSRPVFSLPEDLQLSRPEGRPVSRPGFFLPEDLQVSRPVFSLPEDLQLSRPEGRPVSRPGFFLPEDLQVSRPVFSLPEDLQLSRPEGRPLQKVTAQKTFQTTYS
ncbi:hypothetical protein DY000_02056439 [Brassica cretica]|uniref:Uncharacterized protein n=1 Tax=Brassica cretica TaxID=69181 RepID=A0ABQ7A6U7_BRACR|nr:hypothetical protein DY000_02056439 [Brassica cretica]